MDVLTLRQIADSIEWYHTMDLGQGVVTAGRCNPAQVLPMLHLPDSLAGLRVLDVGAWDGFFSFKCERRGAAEVVATDSYAWNIGTRDRGIRLASGSSGSKVKLREIDVYDLLPSRRKLGQFDVVLFLDVIYHLRHPLLALERVAGMVKPGGLLVLRTLLGATEVGYPAMRFWPNEYQGDFTTWWAPNVPLVEAMLADVGLGNIRMVSGAGEGRATWHAEKAWL